MHFRREEESRRARGECRTGGVWQKSGRAMWQMFTRTRAHARRVVLQSAGRRRGRGRVFPQHVTFATLDWCASSGRHTRIHHALATAATTAMTSDDYKSTNNDDGSGGGGNRDHRTASHVVRERTTKVIPQIQCALPRPLSIRSRNLRCPPPPQGTHGLHTSAPGQPSDQHQIRIASPPPHQPRRLSSCSCTVLHVQRTAASARE